MERFQEPLSGAGRQRPRGRGPPVWDSICECLSVFSLADVTWKERQGSPCVCMCEGLISVHPLNTAGPELWGT